MQDKKVYDNKDSIWCCPECESTTRWRWEDVDNCGSPICGKCDIDMELDTEATENQ